MGGLSLFLNDIEYESMYSLLIDGMQEEDVLKEETLLKNSIHFKTTSSGIKVGENVHDYSKVLSNYYRNNTEETHVAKSDWEYAIIEMDGEEPRQIKMEAQLSEEKIYAYNKLVKEYRDVFVWSYKDLKGVP